MTVEISLELVGVEKLWRHIGSARKLKTRATQSIGNNNVEVATQRLMEFQQLRGSPYAV